MSDDVLTFEIQAVKNLSDDLAQACAEGSLTRLQDLRMLLELAHRRLDLAAQYRAVELMTERRSGCGGTR
jgi:hypothetical protein